MSVSTKVCTKLPFATGPLCETRSASKSTTVTRFPSPLALGRSAPVDVERVQCPAKLGHAVTAKGARVVDPKLVESRAKSLPLSLASLGQSLVGFSSHEREPIGDRL
jgi:hypothetical protein